MFKIGVKILHFIVLLVTGVALIGVNVKQLYCYHSANTHWEVQVLPAGDECHCSNDGCCQKKDCHNQTRHDFYKITDFSRTEPGAQFEFDSFYLPEFAQLVISCLPLWHEEHILFSYEVPDIPIIRELWCTFLC